MKFQINNHWKTVPHTLVFESAVNFTEMLKKSKSPKELMDQMFGRLVYNSILKSHRIRLFIHEEDTSKKGTTAKTKISSEERHFINELKRMQGSKNFETIVGCEIMYGMDIVILGPSEGDINECALQV